MLSRNDVITAYRMLLGRDPESEEAIDIHLAHGTVAKLRRAIMLSPEFDRGYRSVRDARAPIPVERVLPPLSRVDLTDDPRETEAILARTAETWKRLGEERPHHSVMGLPEYQPGSIEGSVGAFFETGREELGLLDAALERLQARERLRQGLCLEIGSGLCRMTLPLAERFAQVLGVDVSAPHLALGREALARSGKANVELRQVSSLEDYAALPQAQFVYSRYVLHHNAPPVQLEMLRAMLGRIARPGAGFFQTVTSIEGYEFDTGAYLAEAGSRQETHPLPQPAIFDAIANLGLRLVEVQRDDTAADQPWLRSFVFLVERQ